MVESDAVPFGQRTQAAVVADDAGDLDRKRARPAAMEQNGEAVRARRYRDDRARLRGRLDQPPRSEEHTSELQSLMRISYAVFCLKKKKKIQKKTQQHNRNKSSR